MLIFNQFTGLGDILFTVPLARHFIKQGEVVVYPYDLIYGDIGKHFPDIGFIPKDMLNINYDYKEEYMIDNVSVIPLRFADINPNNNPNTMSAKYDMFDLDYQMWRELTWKRDINAEERLYGTINPKKDYIIVNKNWHHSNQRKDFAIKTKLEVIEMQNIAGYTLLDWGLLFEHAKEIHTVGTSLVYMLEMMDLKAKLHLYQRPGENGFANYNYLLKKNYTFHI